MLKKAAACLLVLGGMAFWISCSSSTSDRYLYAAIPGSNEIVAYRQDPNAGVLTQLVGSPITAGQSVQGLAIHPSNKYLYATNTGNNNVSFFTIAASGSLNEVTPRANAGTGPTVLAMDPGGKFLYVGNSGSFDLTVFSILSTSSNGLPAGSLTQVGQNIPLGISPLNMKVSPNGNFLYVTGGGNPGTVEVFATNQGALTQLSSSPFATGNDPSGLVISPSGGFLYTANKLDSTISEFTINSDGSLTPISGSPIGLAATGPVALLIDNSGTYLYVANDQSPGLILVFSIGQNGALNLLANSQMSTGAQPSFLATDASGKFLFVGNQSTAQLQSMSIDLSTGILTSVATYPIPSTPTSIVTTP
jgi:6-phosphogluconolactonase (cycloisomerase 2 family)